MGWRPFRRPSAEGITVIPRNDSQWVASMVREGQAQSMPAARSHRPKSATQRVGVVRTADGMPTEGRDTVVVEEPMEIRVGPVGVSDDDLTALAVTMRTPGHDFELAIGFLVTEGIADAGEVRSVAYCGLPPAEQEYNIVTVRIAGVVDVEQHRRNVYTTSSCGICGKASIEAVEIACPHGPSAEPIPGAVVAAIPDTLRSRQRLFDDTGGLHAAGLFDAGGTPIVVREDVGRHNAVDKVVGWAAQQRRLPLSNIILGVSGRASFEIVQKAALAGLAIVVAVSAPSSLAVSAAEKLGVTLVAFARHGTFNVYSHGQRVG